MNYKYKKLNILYAQQYLHIEINIVCNIHNTSKESNIILAK